MIKIGKRTFVPIKVATGVVGYSMCWLREHAPDDFPSRIYLTSRRTGYWLDELQKWLLKRSRNTKSRAA